MGFWFSWLMMRGASLLPAIVGHGAINLFFVFGLRPLFDGANGATPATFHAPLPLLMLGVSLVVLAYGTRRLREALPSPRAAEPVLAAA